MRLANELVHRIAKYFGFYKAIAVLNFEGNKDVLAYSQTHNLVAVGKFAVSMGYYDIVKWLHNNRPSLLVKPIKYASIHGQLRIVVWLHRNGYSCTNDALDNAAWNGHLEVVKLLRYNSTERCTAEPWIIQPPKINLQ